MQMSSPWAECVIPVQELRPWGGFTKFIDNKRATVKLLDMQKDGMTSLQYHKHRSEYLYLIAGRINITTIIDGKEVITELRPGSDFTVMSNVVHRYHALKDSICLEIALGDFDESDIVRVEDKYGRCE